MRQAPTRLLKPSRCVSVATAPAQAGGSGAGVVDQSPAVSNGLLFAGTVPADISVQFATATNPGVVGLGSVGATVQISGPLIQVVSCRFPRSPGTIPGLVNVRVLLASKPDGFADSQNLTVASVPLS